MMKISDRTSLSKVSGIIQTQTKVPKRQRKLINQTYFGRSRNIPVFNCFRLFKSITTLDGSLYLRFLNKTPIMTPQNYMESTRNCSSFITDRGYITHHLTAEERNFPIAFSILMYKDVDQVERLLRTIYRPQNIYCIHVDSKTDDALYRAIQNISHCFDNVFVLNKRVNVTWGEMSVLEPELLCMKELLTRNKRWKYFINLTGQEFPLKTNYELVKILQAYNGSNDVESSVTE
ncbi:beta-1,3-galactosyl-O-glycosyl-glycoprotein beta-1,6-N-acetylglucosaminyltransferase-like [Ruditapes philippinarum]|uniref:beta-1,3-galactosyl-O-glycosyl-glycoprotein beta-1,6-N-acetylglucosaminyltransferase-like n=1 Tax=Ruditapes philippinarum TaxID=129788 RepID=UPI00295BC3C6|nr:beta-1,3-galactosyl-O-glycosyl-glycoprotein beta-1,6-N-acetylglucosaminyltransferase-like [Ruditapes philippinarum]